MLSIKPTYVHGVLVCTALWNEKLTEICPNVSVSLKFS